MWIYQHQHPRSTMNHPRHPDLTRKREGLRLWRAWGLGPKGVSEGAARVCEGFQTNKQTNKPHGFQVVFSLMVHIDIGYRMTTG